MTALHKILVVDDDPVVGTSFDRVLARKGYQVITARNAHEALERLRRDEVDLVYTDIKMPGMDGLELAEKVKQRRPWTPVVIVTGYGTESAERRAMDAGVTAFLRKPLSPEMIEGSATDALQGREHAIALPEPPAAPTVAAAETAAEPVAEKIGLARTIGNIALFFAAPFIGLAYAVLLPFVGLAALAWIGLKAFAESNVGRHVVPRLKFAAILLTAPLLGLVFVVVLPFAGLATLGWIAGRTLVARQTAA